MLILASFTGSVYVAKVSWIESNYIFVINVFINVFIYQYALYKKMTQAAILIQSKFRSYHEQKKFQQSRRAAVLIQQCYRSYREFGRLRPHRRAATAALVQHKLRYCPVINHCLVNSVQIWFQLVFDLLCSANSSYESVPRGILFWALPCEIFYSCTRCNVQN